MWALWQRARRGPRYANWSWLMESVADLTIDAVPDRSNIAVQEVRELFHQTAMLPIPTLVSIAAVTLGGVVGECHRPRRVAPRRVVLFFHGGGYVAGSPQSHRLLTTRIAKEAEALLYSMAYRLAPEHPYPAALEDAWCAYVGLLAQGVSPQHIVIGGDSAGGGLTVALLLALLEAQLPLPAGAFCLSPFFDLSCETAAQWVERRAGASERRHARKAFAEESAKDDVLADYINLNILRCSGAAYCGVMASDYPYISPLFAQLHDLPPLLIQAGSTEVLAADAMRFTERAHAAGVDVQLTMAEHMLHVYQFLYHIAPEAEAAVREIGHFVRRRIGATARNG
ncbi:MAG: alpha/beta hydrolase fold domain-containing protein [Caldilineaceae bacterium]|nr:alpha/beta hydrolase fold domain-containing protein [Caldilineaceae bacterium]